MYRTGLSSIRAIANAGRTALVLGTVAALSSSILPQRKPAVEPQTEKQLRIETTLVTLSVSVTDKSGKPVLGLRKDNFRIKENGVLQEISFFSDSETPASILFLFDVSGSMSGTKIIDAGNALHSFYKTSHPDDEYLGLAFNDEVRSAPVDGRDFGKIQAWLKSYKPDGNTALFDGVARAIKRIRRSIYPKRVIVVISDGDDNNSKIAFNDLRELVKESEAIVYAVSISRKTGGKFSKLGEARLEELAKLSGGWAVASDSDIQMDETFERLALEIRHRYSFAYSPRDWNGDGKWRNLKLELNAPPSKTKMRIRTRRGYFATAVP